MRVIRGLCALVLCASGWTAAPDGFWGGAYATSTGERVTVYSSTAYTVDESVNQRWANFMASLVHGPELGEVSVYLAPPAEVAGMCGGSDVFGCYANDRIVAPGKDTSETTTASALAHEYGHHVAAHRVNAPWRASAWGTKRWASYLQVCRETRKRQMFPGSQQPLLYLVNPGEGFAEAYRVLNENRLGLARGRWRVDDVFLPNARALALIEQDVVDPWSANRTVTLRAKSRRLTVATPLDGSFSVSASRVQIDVLAGKKRLARGAGSVSTQVCGARTLTLRLSRSATLTISRP
jgi:hypothetical protein